MALRVDIDDEDLAALRKDVGKRVTKQTAAFMTGYGVLLTLAIAAASGAHVFFSEILSAGAQLAPLAMLSPCLALVGLCAAAAFYLFRTQTKLRADAESEAVRAGITTGRFEFFFTDASLIAKGALSMRKAPWASLDRIEETKSSIVFWRRSAVFAFIPKNVLTEPAFFERLKRAYGGAISNKLSLDESHGANPHKITFEEAPRDYEEYWQDYANRRDKRLGFLRALLRWRPWPAVLLTLSVQSCIAAGLFAFQSLNLPALAAAFMAAIFAGATFWLNAAHFRGPAFPFRKDRNWPYARTVVAGVTLSKAGVSVTRGAGEEIFPWGAVTGFMNCRLTAYLVLTPQLVVALPRRAFLNKVHFQTFANFARAHIDTAHKAAEAESRQRLTRSLAPGVKTKKADAKPAGKSIPAQAASKLKKKNSAQPSQTKQAGPGASKARAAKATKTPAAPPQSGRQATSLSGNSSPVSRRSA